MIFHSTVQDTVPPTGIKTISKKKIQKMGKFVKRKTVRIFVSGCENYRSVDAGCGKGGKYLCGGPFRTVLDVIE